MLLAEELLLLAIDDEIGKISTSVSGSIHYGIAGAFLLDLGIREKIKIENKKLKIIDEDPTGNLILDEIMELLKQGKFRRKIRYVIVSLGNLYTKLYRKELFKRLTERGILNRVEKKKFKIFRTVRHPV